MFCWIVFQIQFLYAGLFQNWQVTVVSQMSHMDPVIIFIHYWHQIYTQHTPKQHTHVIHQKIRWLLVQTKLACTCAWMDEDNDLVHMGAAYMGPSENSRLTIYSSSLYECHFKYLLLFNQVNSLNKLLWVQCSQPVAM
jgi:hypothetical protein